MTDLTFRQYLPEPILTPRLILRAPVLADVPALTRLANNAKISETLALLPSPYGQADAVRFVENLARTQTNHAYAILTRDEALIGVAGLTFTPHGVEIGYWIGEPYWDEGYASEAVAALSDAAIAAGCHAIEARTLTRNAASRRVLEKSHFVRIKDGIDSVGKFENAGISYFRREGPR